MKIKKTFALMLVFLIVITAFCSCKNNNTPYSSQNYVMDTTLSQKIYSKSDISDKVYSALLEWENTFSAFKESSQIYGVNNAGGQSVSVSKQSFDLVKKGVEYSQESEGRFDISVYPLSSLWKQAIENKNLPDNDEVSDRKSKVDFSKITLDEANLKITVPEGMGLDLGAIAKGAALDTVREIYEQNGVSGAICSLGNSAMLLYGSKRGEDFKIGLKNPLKDAQNELFAALSLSDCVISTSGGYERYAEIEGKKYHHIIDTKTGYPAESDIASVTVVGQNGAFCDYMSTRLFVEGTERAIKTIEQNNLDAAIVTNNKKVYVSKTLESRFEITDGSFERIN